MEEVATQEHLSSREKVFSNDTKKASNEKAEVAGGKIMSRGFGAVINEQVAGTLLALTLNEERGVFCELGLRDFECAYEAHKKTS